METGDMRLVTVLRCARCGQDHELMLFRRIKGQPMEDADGVTWTYWGICPTTGDPVMLRDDSAASGAPDGEADA
jgi:hypothetical protein